MMAAGDQLGWNDLTYAAAPLVCGQAMEVPEMMLYSTDRVSLGEPDTLPIVDQAAKMSMPGALISGYRQSNQPLNCRFCQ